MTTKQAIEAVREFVPPMNSAWMHIVAKLTSLEQTPVMMKQIAVSVSATPDGHAEKRTVCVDERGRAWELAGKKWVRMPDLPEEPS